MTSPSTVIARNEADIQGDALPNVPKNVDHLHKEPTELDCPACHRRCITRVEREAVTCLQRIIATINCCCLCNPIRWSGRHDINHYCSKCGCYIGRQISLSWYKRQLFKMQRSDVVTESRWQRFRKVDKEQLDLSKQNRFLPKKAAQNV